MAHFFFEHLPQIQLSLYAIYLHMCSMMWLCDNTGTCPVQTAALTRHRGFPTAEVCNVMTGGAAVCSIMCSTTSQCKIVYVTSCSSNQTCTCVYCDKLTDVDFTVTTFQFYLHTQEIAVSTSSVDLTGGLIAGQPILIKANVGKSETSIRFKSSNRDQAFATKFMFDQKIVLSNSYLSNKWGKADRSTPYFNFTDGQEISMFYVVTTVEYKLYIDGFLFKIFPHRVPITDIKSLELWSTSAEATLLSFHR